MFKDADERPVQPLAKAYPLAKTKAPMPFQPSVSSSAPSYPILTKHAHLPPAAIAPAPSDHAVGDPPTPRMRRPHPRTEIDPAQWNAQVAMLWAKFPEDDAPVLRWLRERAHPYRDAFFASDGTMRAITREALRVHQLPFSTDPDQPKPPRGIALHDTLHYQLSEALKARDYLRDPRTNAFYPIASEKDWRRISHSGSSLTLDYHFICSRCYMVRIVRRTDAPAVDALPSDYAFQCEDVGVECDVPHLIPCEFLPRTYRPLTPPVATEVPAGTSGGAPQPTTSAQPPPPRTTSQDSGSGTGSLPLRRSTRLQQQGAAP